MAIPSSWRSSGRGLGLAVPAGVKAKGASGSAGKREKLSHRTLLPELW